MRGICQHRKFPKWADLFTSAHKYLCSLFLNFLAADCSNTVLILLPLTSLSKIPPKATKALPWQTLAGLPQGTKALWFCLDMPILTKTTRARGWSPIRILLPVPQWFYNLPPDLWLCFCPFSCFSCVTAQPAPGIAVRTRIPALLGRAEMDVTSPALSLLHSELVNHPSRLTTRVKHLCLSSLVSALAFTSLICPLESGLDWGGDEKSLC